MLGCPEVRGVNLGNIFDSIVFLSGEKVYTIISVVTN